jgi:hypothetical protein
MAMGSPESLAPGHTHGGATANNGRRRVRLKALTPAAADYLFGKIESDPVACIDKGDVFGAVEQTMAKPAVLEGPPCSGPFSEVARGALPVRSRSVIGKSAAPASAPVRVDDCPDQHNVDPFSLWRLRRSGRASR